MAPKSYNVQAEGGVVALSGYNSSVEHEMAQAADLYATLGIGRTADEREVKKAYFRLIRQYGPESHPEEFKRLRHAYEILSNAASRADYDELTQHGPAIGQTLRRGRDAMDRGDLLTAQEAFKAVLLERDDLHMARDLLGMAYLNNNQPREALRQFDQLLRAQPGVAAYHLHRGYALYALDQYREAVGAYQQARELDPANTKIRVALSDSYTAMDRFDDALGELERALSFVGAGAGGTPEFQDFVFLMRKVQIQLLRDRVDLAEAEIDRVVSLLPQDPEVRRYVSQKLCSLASQLFRIKRGADGNRLLLRAQRLSGRAGTPLIFPPRVQRRLSALSRTARAHVERLSHEPQAHKLVHGVWGGPALMLGLSVLMLWWPLSQAATARSVWHGNTWAVMMGLLFLGPLLLALALLRVYRVVSSPVGRFTTIHPLYLLQVDLDHVIGWPLVNLHDVSMTHHLQNGVYQHTTVRAEFAGAQLNLTIRGQQAAVDWAQSLLDARHRCLGLMAVGMLEEEDGADLLALATPETGRPSVARRVTERLVGDRPAAWQVVSVAGLLLSGAGLCTGAAALNRRVADDSHYALVRGAGRLSLVRAYLQTWPAGRHAAEARAWLEQAYGEAQRRLGGEARRPPATAALQKVLAALQQATPARPEVQVRVQGTGVSGARADGRDWRMTSALVWGLGRALSRRVSPDVMLLVAEQPGAADGPVVLHVTYALDLKGLEGVAGLPGTPGPAGVPVRWKAQLRASGQTVFETEIVTLVREAPDGDGADAGDEANDAAMLSGRRLEPAFQEFGRRLADELGL